MSRTKLKIPLLFIFLVMFGLCSGCVGSEKGLLNISADASGVGNETSIDAASADMEQNKEQDAEQGSKSASNTGANETGLEISNETRILNLIQDLESSSHETRLDTVSELGEIGEPAADALIKKLGAKDSKPGDMNNYIILALLETGDERAADVLIRSLDKGEELFGQNETEKYEGGEISEEMLQAVEAKVETLRKYLADSLDDEYGTEADALVQALNSKEQDADIYVNIALSEYSGEETGDKNETERLVHALKSGKGSIRIAAALALGELEEKSAVEPMLQILTRDYPLQRSSAALSLGMIGDERAVETLLKELKADKDKNVRSGSALALGKIGEERAVSLLIQRLGDKKADVRGSAALSLGMIGDETAVEPLIEVLESGKAADGRVKSVLNANPEVRKSAVLTLGEIGCKDATEVLINVLVDEEEPQEVRKAAAQALGEIGDPRAVEALSGVLNDAEIPTSITGGVISGLGNMGDKKAAEALIEQIDDTKLGSAVRDALAGMGETAVGPLIETLESDDEKLKEEVALLLIEIGDERAVEPLTKAFR